MSIFPGIVYIKACNKVDGKSESLEKFVADSKSGMNRRVLLTFCFPDPNFATS